MIDYDGGEDEEVRGSLDMGREEEEEKEKGWDVIVMGEGLEDVGWGIGKEKEMSGGEGNGLGKYGLRVVGRGEREGREVGREFVVMGGVGKKGKGCEVEGKLMGGWRRMWRDGDVKG